MSKFSMPRAAAIILVCLGLLAGLAVGGVAGWYLRVPVIVEREVRIEVPVKPETPPTPEPPATPAPPLSLSAVAFAALPGWNVDAAAPALAAFRRSCSVLDRRSADSEIGVDAIGGLARDWREACAAVPADNPDDATARAFFENHFIPFAVDTPEGPEGLFTGYYEPELAGALSRSGAYPVPLYKRPADLIGVDLGRFFPDLSGQRTFGRVAEDALAPYYSRRDIDIEGKLNDRDLELVWLTDPLDQLILHIQGSGRVKLPDGNIMRVGFAAHNGHTYASVGRELIERGELESGQASWPKIRAWLEAHPKDAPDILAVNPRYIFFRELQGEGPLGALGIPLTPGRSMAIDARRMPLGAPVFVATTWPDGNETPMQRLFVAQDVGGAIKGAVRGDLFFGAGAEAEKIAGSMKYQGRYWLLLPYDAARRHGWAG